MSRATRFPHALRLVNDNLPSVYLGHVDLNSFEIWLRSWGAAAETIAARMTLLRAAARDLDLACVTTAELEAWLGNPEWSGWTRSTYYGHLRSLCEWMRKVGLRVDDPSLDVRRPVPPKGVPRPLSPVEVSLVLAGATGHLRMWLLLGLYAGLRAHEVAKVRGEDVSALSLYVLGKGSKQAILPTSPIIWQAAQDYPRVGLWFPSDTSASGHVHPKTISTQVTRLFSSLGIPGSSHRARHTYGTSLLRNGANIRVVQQLMRHESLASTEIYTQVADDEMIRAVASLGAA